MSREVFDLKLFKNKVRKIRVLAGPTDKSDKNELT